MVFLRIAHRLRNRCTERREYKKMTEQDFTQRFQPPSLNFPLKFNASAPYLPGSAAGSPVYLDTPLDVFNPASIFGSSGSNVDTFGLGQIFYSKNMRFFVRSYHPRITRAMSECALFVMFCRPV